MNQMNVVKWTKCGSFLTPFLLISESCDNGSRWHLLPLCWAQGFPLKTRGSRSLLVTVMGLVTLTEHHWWPRVDWETGTPWHLLPNSPLHIYALNHPQMDKHPCCSPQELPAGLPQLCSPSVSSHTQNLCPGEPRGLSWSFPHGLWPLSVKAVLGVKNTNHLFLKF